jgi:two-component system, NarL family, sensor kinase
VAPLEDRGVGVQVRASAEDDLDQPVVDLVLRTAQEAVRNILRHARARSVAVRLQSDDDELLLTVTDDGDGFPADLRPGRPDSMGLNLLSGLAQTEGGRIDVRSEPGTGTELELVVPRRVREPVPA